MSSCLLFVLTKVQIQFNKWGWLAFSFKTWLWFSNWETYSWILTVSFFAVFLLSQKLINITALREYYSSPLFSTCVHVCTYVWRLEPKAGFLSPLISLYWGKISSLNTDLTNLTSLAFSGFFWSSCSSPPFALWDDKQTATSTWHSCGVWEARLLSKHFTYCAFSQEHHCLVMQTP